LGLQDLNGKLLPLLEYNQRKYPWLQASDYLNLESFMKHLNSSKLRQRTFNFAGEGIIATAFRKVMKTSAMGAHGGS
jgi:hypothetical protein